MVVVTETESPLSEKYGVESNVSDASGVEASIVSLNVSPVSTHRAPAASMNSAFHVCAQM